MFQWRNQNQPVHAYNKTALRADVWPPKVVKMPHTDTPDANANDVN